LLGHLEKDWISPRDKFEDNWQCPKNKKVARFEKQAIGSARQIAKAYILYSLTFMNSIPRNIVRAILKPKSWGVVAWSPLRVLSSPACNASTLSVLNVLC
jgi:hypothetical protein